MHKKNRILFLFIVIVSIFLGIGINEAFSVSRYLHEITETLKISSMHLLHSQDKNEWSYTVIISLHNPTHKTAAINIDSPILRIADFMEMEVDFSGREKLSLAPGQSIQIMGFASMPEPLFRELRLSKTTKLYFTSNFVVSAGNLWKIKNHIQLFHDEYIMYF